MRITLVPDVPENPEEVYEEMLVNLIDQLLFLYSEEELDVTDTIDISQKILEICNNRFDTVLPQNTEYNLSIMRASISQAVLKNASNVTFLPNTSPQKHKYFSGFVGHALSRIETIKALLIQKLEDRDSIL